MDKSEIKKNILDVIAIINGFKKLPDGSFLDPYGEKIKEMIDGFSLNDEFVFTQYSLSEFLNLTESEIETLIDASFAKVEQAKIAASQTNWQKEGL